MTKINQLKLEMFEYFKGDAKRIQHFIKVHSFSKLIGELEGLSQEQQEILELAAVVHDIGIKPGEEKFGRNDGKIQEQEGPAPARAMLEALGVEEYKIERICYLIAHHYTYNHIDGADYQILVEADFLVNLYEDGVTESAIRSAYEKIFCTASGRKLCTDIYFP